MLMRHYVCRKVVALMKYRDRLQTMLSTHAVDGKVVSREDIDAVFADLRGTAR